MSTAVASYDVAPDGHFLMISPGKTSAAVHVVLNWFEEELENARSARELNMAS